MAYITEVADHDYYRFQEDLPLPLIANLCEALKPGGVVMERNVPVGHRPESTTAGGFSLADNLLDQNYSDARLLAPSCGLIA